MLCCGYRCGFLLCNLGWVVDCDLYDTTTELHTIKQRLCQHLHEIDVDLSTKTSGASLRRDTSVLELRGYLTSSVEGEGSSYTRSCLIRQIACMSSATMSHGVYVRRYNSYGGKLGMMA